MSNEAAADLQLVETVQTRIAQALDILERTRGCYVESLSAEGPTRKRCESNDLHCLICTISDMAQEYALLVHKLELINLDRLRYYKEFPNMVINFRNLLRGKEIKCQAHSLLKLRSALQETRVASKELFERKRYLKLMREDNDRLQGLADEVKKETEAITSTIMTYYDRRSENTNAIARASQSVVATEDRIDHIEVNNAMETEEWDELNSSLRWKDYELRLHHCVEADEILEHAQMTRKSRGDESLLMQSIAQIVKEINTSKKDYKINLGIVNTQRKIKEAAAGSFHDGDITFFTVEDLERWRTQLQNPETFLDSELEAPEREPVNVEEEKQLLRDEAVEFPRHDGDTTNEQMKSIFSESAVSEYRNMSDAERKHWETLVGTFHGTDMHDQISAMARLQEKLDTDSRRKQRTSDAKSKKVERLKKFVQDLHDDTRLLQQNSDNIHNRISDCMEDEMTAIEEMESEIKQIADTMAAESQTTNELKEEFQRIRASLDTFTEKTTIEIDDALDRIADFMDEEELISDNMQIEARRDTLLKTEITHARVVRQQQDKVRGEIARGYGKTYSRIADLEAEHKRVLAILNGEEKPLDMLYSSYSNVHAETSIICRNLQETIEESNLALAQWKAKTAEAKTLCDAVNNNFMKYSTKISTFTNHLEEDLAVLSQVHQAYDITRIICRRHSQYAEVQTRKATRASEDLTTFIERITGDRPKIDIEVKFKHDAVTGYMDRILHSSTASPEHEKSTSFFQQANDVMTNLNSVSHRNTQFLDLLETQCRKLNDIADRFVPCLLRK